MNIEKYNFHKSTMYVVFHKNDYAYSFINTKILEKKDELKIEDVISNISSSYNYSDSRLISLRSFNHNKYYDIDIQFLKDVDDRYKDRANKLLAAYSKINSLKLLTADIKTSLTNKKILDFLEDEINKLKKKIGSDLESIEKYANNEEQKINTQFLHDDNDLANKLKEKYNNLKINNDLIDINNINLRMSRQKNRLISIRELYNLSIEYGEKRNKYIYTDYTEEQINNLKQNLSLILGNFIYLLSPQEFHFIREIYKDIINDNYNYLNNFLPTYKLVIDKVWKHCLSDYKNNDFDFNYLICNIDYDNGTTKLYLMNRENMNEYSDNGFICSYKGRFSEVFNITKEQLLSLKTPLNITDKYLCSDNINMNFIYLEAVYVKNHSKNLLDSRFPIVEID